MSHLCCTHVCVWQADILAETQGKKGKYFVKHLQYGNSFQYSLNDAESASMEFVTDRMQQSFVTLEMAADSLRFILQL